MRPARAPRPTRLVALAAALALAPLGAAQPSDGRSADAPAPPDSVAAGEPVGGSAVALASAVVWSPAPGLVVVAADSASLATSLEPAPAEPAAEAATPLGAGVASYYGERFRGRRTASGERFDPDRLTAAHRTLPFGTRLRVTNIRTGQSVVVRVNDRGPFHGSRVIDLSKGAARRIGLLRSGTGRVRIERLH